MRAEHPQTAIDRALYHEAAGHPALPVGEYQLSVHVGSRCVYSFCMCPGGQVVAAASEEGGVVTNGMSYHARAGANANAAVVVSVDGADFHEDPRQAIAFQRGLEQAAFAAGGGGYAAPAQTMNGFLAQKAALDLKRVQPTYDRGVMAADLNRLLPEELAAALRQGLAGFDPQAERLYRAGHGADRPGKPAHPARCGCCGGRTLCGTALPGLYPCGEGAGYAGGIVSAAVDGVRVARALCEEYAPPEPAVEGEYKE